jgi:hypothetical protein
VSAAPDGATAATQHHQDQSDDQHDDACRPEDPDSEKHSEEKENKSENNHALQIPVGNEHQTFRQALKTARPEGSFSFLQDSINR